MRDTSPAHCTMGLGRSLDLRWMKKMAGGREEPNDQTVYCNAQWTSDERGH